MAETFKKGKRAISIDVDEALAERKIFQLTDMVVDSTQKIATRYLNTRKNTTTWTVKELEKNAAGEIISIIDLYEGDWDDTEDGLSFIPTGISIVPIAPTVTNNDPANPPTFDWSAITYATQYRYKYTTQKESAWTITTDTEFTPTSALATGTHILEVQSGNAYGEWSSSDTSSIVIA